MGSSIKPFENSEVKNDAQDYEYRQDNIESPRIILDVEKSVDSKLNALNK